MRLALHATPEARLAQSPQALAAFAHELQMSGARFEQQLRRELEDNPFLERVEPSCLSCGGQIGCRWCVVDPRRGSAITWQPDVADPATGPDDLVVELLQHRPCAGRRVVVGVVESLDPRGLLDEPIRSVAVRLGCEVADVQDVVDLLRRVVGPGIAAPSQAEHLRRCLAASADADGGLVGRAATLLDDLLRGTDIAELARRDPEAMDLLASLPPFPLSRAAPADTAGPVIPDLAIIEEGGRLITHVVEADRLGLRVAQDLVDPDSSLLAARRRAQEVVHLAHRRWRTFALVGDALADLQADHLRGLATEPAPLTRRHVAEVTGLHESTVGRVVRARWLQWPDGHVGPLDVLFDPAARCKAELRRLVAAEDEPLSDQRLADALGRCGHRVSRRTVAAYRVELGIAAARARATTGG